MDVVAQSGPTFACDPMDCPLPGSSVHRILQARIIEWVAMPSSRGSFQPRDWTQVSFTAGRFFTCRATSHLYHPFKKKKLFLWKTSTYVKLRNHWTPITHNLALTVTNYWSTFSSVLLPHALHIQDHSEANPRHFIIAFVNISERISES